MFIALAIAVVVYAVFHATRGEAQSTNAPQVQPIAGQKAFPKVLGYGALSTGGRGGKIMYVTTLADSGPGSFRECVTARGPRVCVFRVNGTIRFTRKPPWITNAYLTIAGQTAPGSGITLSHGPGPMGLTPLVIKDTHDIVVRNIRVRNDIPGDNREAEDNITIENSRRIVIDHVSTSWARDEDINGYGDTDEVTISNSIFSWGIPKHDKCALLASDPIGPQKMSFVNNICAHNGDRNPDMNFPTGSCVEVVNNVLYNAESEFAEVWESYGGTPVSIVGNTILAGPNTHSTSRGIARERYVSTGMAKIYLWDNHFEGAFPHVSPEVVPAIVNSTPCPLTAAPMKQSAAFAHVMATAGTFPRDAIDRQVIDDINGRKGRIGKPAPAIPASTPAQPYPDADHDGMDDDWERSVGLNPAVNDAWSDRNGDGIPNFEEFLSYREKKLGY